jgi:sec-independent protein translocase protein TatA
MGGVSLSHILLLVLVVLIVFGAGKLPQVMGDLAKGVRAFKDGLKDQDNDSKDKNKNKE